MASSIAGRSPAWRSSTARQGSSDSSGWFRRHSEPPSEKPEPNLLVRRFTMPFAKYKNTPFLRYIVPIIPVGAKLAEGCKIKPENLGKIPGVRNPNGTWSGFGNFNRHISTNAIMDAFAAFYKHEGYTETVGILGREFICFDADTEYEAAIDIMRRNALFWLGETYERTRSNSKKFALIYRRRPNTPPIKK